VVLVGQTRLARLLLAAAQPQRLIQVVAMERGTLAAAVVLTVAPTRGYLPALAAPVVLVLSSSGTQTRFTKGSQLAAQP
jgi:hypothetical protein